MRGRVGGIACGHPHVEALFETRRETRRARPDVTNIGSVVEVSTEKVAVGGSASTMLSANPVTETTTGATGSPGKNVTEAGTNVSWSNVTCGERGDSQQQQSKTG
jgi:hypothetical protein